jgi:membrane-associated phospholipid phosphatase
VIPEEALLAPRDTQPRKALSRTAGLAIIGGVLIPLGVFAALAAAVAGKGALGWDADILRLADRYYRPSAVSALSTALEVMVWLLAAIAATIVILLLRRRKLRHALFFTLAVGGVVALDPPLKELFHRPLWSPTGHDSGVGYAFPSGSAMASMAMVVSLALMSSRWPRWTLAGGAFFLVTVGILLVYAWWHYPSDVVAGWCFALAWVTGLWLLFRVSPLPARPMPPSDRASGMVSDGGGT